MGVEGGAECTSTVAATTETTAVATARAAAASAAPALPAAARALVAASHGAPQAPVSLHPLCELKWRLPHTLPSHSISIHGPMGLLCPSHSLRVSERLGTFVCGSHRSPIWSTHTALIASHRAG